MFDFAKEELIIAMKHLTKEELILLYNERKLICEMYRDIMQHQQKEIQTLRNEVEVIHKANQQLERELYKFQTKPKIS